MVLLFNLHKCSFQHPPNASNTPDLFQHFAFDFINIHLKECFFHMHESTIIQQQSANYSLFGPRKQPLTKTVNTKQNKTKLTRKASSGKAEQIRMPIWRLDASVASPRMMFNSDRFLSLIRPYVFCSRCLVAVCNFHILLLFLIEMACRRIDERLKIS